MNETLKLLDEYLSGKVRKTFVSDVPHRKVVIWYDKNKENKELVDSIINNTYDGELTDKLKDAKFLTYDNNSFEIRCKLELEDLNTDYVIYVPFDRPKPEDNGYLLDIESFNFDYIFIPDTATLKVKSFDLSIECKEVIEKYKSFFKDKKRENKFKQRITSAMVPQDVECQIIGILLNIENVTTDNILKALIYNFYEDKQKYDETIKYAENFIINLFKSYLKEDFDKNKDIENLFFKIIFTHFVRDIEFNKEVEKTIDKYGVFYNRDASTNCYILVNSLMKDKETSKVFENMSNLAYKEIGVLDILNNISLNAIKSCDTFKEIDNLFIKYIISMIIKDDFDYKKVIDVINIRKKKYWYKECFLSEYDTLEMAVSLLSKLSITSSIENIKDLKEFINKYENLYSEIDTYYRKYHANLEKIENKDDYLALTDIIDNKYEVDFIQALQEKWYKLIDDEKLYSESGCLKQTDFYEEFISKYNDKKDRVFIIISDAFRYECGKELYLNLNKFASNVSLNTMISTIPSYTKLGMAALLPHKRLKINDKNDDILVDDINSSSIDNRDKILKKYNEKSMAIKYESLISMTKQEWKKELSGYKYIYIYHNVIDNVGEHDGRKVFSACDTCVKELRKLVIDLHTTFSTITMYITSDHGFFYQNKRTEDYMKTNSLDGSLKVKDRYSYSKNKSEDTGIISFKMNVSFDGGDGYINIPKGYNVFNKQGSYNSYLHGGSLPQELLLPLIYIKTKREDSNGDNRLGKKVGIVYSSITKKITNAITYLEFVQDNPVSDDFRECRYILHFEDENGNIISDETTIVANLTSTEIKERYFKEKFVFKNIIYNKNIKYKLVIIDEETGVVAKEVEFIIDITIVNNFDF